MINWRTILKAPSYTQNTQNEQNTPEQDNFADIADIAHSITSQTPAPAVPMVDHSATSATSLIAGGPASPLPTYCFVTYTDCHGRLCGGGDERATSTVKGCHGTGQGCEVELSDGRRIPLRSIRAVCQTNEDGRLVAAWTVREHGYDCRTEGRPSRGQ
jgi:hypothetical protein